MISPTVLDKLIPSTIDPDASDQDIINATYQDRLGEKMLAFIYQIQNNVYHLIDLSRKNFFSLNTQTFQLNSQNHTCLCHI